jgi:hypothetical protein
MASACKRQATRRPRGTARCQPPCAWRSELRDSATSHTAVLSSGHQAACPIVSDAAHQAAARLAGLADATVWTVTPTSREVPQTLHKRPNPAAGACGGARAAATAATAAAVAAGAAAVTDGVAVAAEGSWPGPHAANALPGHTSAAWPLQRCPRRHNTHQRMAHAPLLAPTATPCCRRRRQGAAGGPLHTSAWV